MKLILQAIKSLFAKTYIVIEECKKQILKLKEEVKTEIDGLEAEIVEKEENINKAIDKKMDKENPIFESSITLGSRREGAKIGKSSVAIGNNVEASAEYSVAFGSMTYGRGIGCFVEGLYNGAYGSYSHAEGEGTMAKGKCSHAEGYRTYAEGDYTHVQGKFNIKDEEQKYAHIVGNGEDTGKESNAHTLDWNGNAWFAGSVEGTAIILTSSSGKRFNITVTDTGSLTATEITE